MESQVIVTEGMSHFWMRRDHDTKLVGLQVFNECVIEGYEVDAFTLCLASQPEPDGTHRDLVGSQIPLHVAALTPSTDFAANLG